MASSGPQTEHITQTKATHWAGREGTRHAHRQSLIQLHPVIYGLMASSQMLRYFLYIQSIQRNIILTNELSSILNRSLKTIKIVQLKRINTHGYKFCKSYPYQNRLHRLLWNSWIVFLLFSLWVDSDFIYVACFLAGLLFISCEYDIFMAAGWSVTPRSYHLS